MMPARVREIIGASRLQPKIPGEPGMKGSRRGGETRRLHYLPARAAPGGRARPAGSGLVGGDAVHDDPLAAGGDADRERAPLKGAEACDLHQHVAVQP